MAGTSMGVLRRRVLRFAGVGLLLALLGVPIALTGHHHDSLGAASAESCAVCGALGGAATALLRTPPQLVLQVREYAQPSSVISAPASRTVVTQSARGPPALLVSRFA
jgi:hypothetical protein